MATKKSNGYKKMNSEFKKLEKKGDSVEGYLLAVDVLTFEPRTPGDKPGHAPKLTMRALNGEDRFSVLCGSTVVTDAQALSIGSKTKVVFEGMGKTNKGNKVGGWSLYQDHDDVIEM